MKIVFNDGTISKDARSRLCKTKEVRGMSLNEIKDRLFDILNETDNLPIADIMVNDAKNNMKVYLEDGTVVTLTCELTGVWQVIR